MALGSIQTLTELSTRSVISWGTIVMKSGSLNLLEHSRPVQACTGIALPDDSKTVRRGAAGRHRIFQNNFLLLQFMCIILLNGY